MTLEYVAAALQSGYLLGFCFDTLGNDFHIKEVSKPNCRSKYGDVLRDLS